MGQRVRNIPVGFDVLIGMLMGHPLCEMTSNIPAEAFIQAVHIDPARRTVILTTESATFVEVPDGSLITDFLPTHTVTVTEMAMLADLISNRHDYCPHCGEPLAEDP